MCTLLVDAQEGRDVATADVVGAYLNADMNDFFLIKLTGDAVDILTSINAKYTTFVTVSYSSVLTKPCMAASNPLSYGTISSPVPLWVLDLNSIHMTPVWRT
jgi:hypothetical protein